MATGPAEHRLCRPNGDRYELCFDSGLYGSGLSHLGLGIGLDEDNTGLLPQSDG